MSISCKIVFIGWIFIFIGIYSLIEIIVGIFIPVIEPKVKLYFISPQINFAVFFLPLGFGLLKRNPACRRLSLVFLGLIIILLVGTFFISAISIITGNSPFKSASNSITGDDIAEIIGMFIIVLPVIFWQFRVLLTQVAKQFF